MSLLRERVRDLRSVADEEAFRRAASALMSEALQPVAGPDAARALFDACDALSAEAYERGDAKGALLVLARGHPAIDVLLELERPTPLARTRAARKLLELSLGDVLPLSDGTVLWGLGRVARAHDPSRGELFEVRFTGRSRWELRRGGEALFAVEGRAAAPVAPWLAREAFEDAARELLGTHGAPELARLWAAVSAVIATARGITVVVSRDAAAEARRLAAQGTRIAPRALEPEVVQAATGIGGALLLDRDGVCHAIGVILDGIATPRGERSRGSRYNSAANYVRGRTGTLAVVVSDDGSVDLLAGESSRPIP